MYRVPRWGAMSLLHQWLEGEDIYLHWALAFVPPDVPCTNSHAHPNQGCKKTLFCRSTSVKNKKTHEKVLHRNEFQLMNPRMT